MKARDKARKDSLSALVSAVKKLAIDEGKRDDIPEEVVDRAIMKEQKTAKEQLDTCPKERTSFFLNTQTRYDVISEYAPKFMSYEEVKTQIQANYSELLASGNKGMIMKTLMQDFNGKADGKVINQVVAELCR